MGRVLPYVAGGVAFGGYTIVTNDQGTIYADRRSVTGWTIGAGADYAFTDKLIGRFGYRYTDFGDKSYADGYGYNVGLKTHELRVGIAYKF